MRRTLLLAWLLSACSPDAPPPTPASQIPEATYGDLSTLGDTVALDAPLGATRVGLLAVLDDPASPAPDFEARGIDADGVAGPWVPVAITWREGAQVVGRAELPALATRAELRLPEAATVAQLTWSALVPQPLPELEAPELEAPGEIAASRQALRADIAALGVRSREDWGARPTRCVDLNEAKDKIAIHHTVTNPMTEPTSGLRGIQSYHMDTRGWCDVGYHFLVSLDGQVWEGRPVEFLGAHVANHNTGNIGISFMGCFHPSGGCESFPPQMPPDAMIQGGADMVAGIAGLYGIPIDSTTVKGHRDHAGATTSCPGDYLHARLDELRSNGTVMPRDVFGARFVRQSFPLASQPFELAPLEEVEGFLDLENTGTVAWTPGETFLAATEPRDGASALEGPGWVSASRAATVDAETPPGATGRFTFTVRAPADPGTYPQFFGLVDVGDGEVWFSDPGHRGPPDGQLEVRATVLDVPPWVRPDPDAGTAPDAGLGDAGPEPEPMDDGGCSCRAAGARPGPSPKWLFLGLFLLVARRRRT